MIITFMALIAWGLVVGAFRRSGLMILTSLLIVPIYLILARTNASLSFIENIGLLFACLTVFQASFLVGGAIPSGVKSPQTVRDNTISTRQRLAIGM